MVSAFVNTCTSPTLIWVKIAVLQIMKLLTGYAMIIMITYLTSVWEFHLADAAAVVNVYAGAVDVISMGMIMLVDTVIDNHRLIVLCGWAHTMGFGLLTLSTPPVLYRATGTCSGYKKDCISKVQVILFYTALTLIALGESGRFMVDAFNSDQLLKPLQQGAKLKQIRFTWKKMKFGVLSCYPKRLLLVSFQIIISILVFVVTAYAKPWSLKFGLAAIFTLLATIILLTSTIQPFRKERNLFDREEIISILRMTPICILLIPVLVVVTLRNTYFTEQAGQMNHKVETLKVSVLFLTYPAGWLSNWIIRSPFLAKISTPRKGISLATALAIICCINAALVEHKRLGVVKRHGLLEKPDEPTPMSMFWLLPQFILVGGVSGLSVKCIANFFICHVLHWPELKNDVDIEAPENPKSPVDDQANKVSKSTELKNDEDGIQEKQQTKSAEKDEKEENIDPERKKQESKRMYLQFFAGALKGVGNISSVLIVYFVKKRRPTWFGETINRSRVDNFYWLLAALTATAFVVFVPVIFCLVRPNGNAGAATVDIDETEGDIADEVKEVIVEMAAEKAEQVDKAGEDENEGDAR